jgi:hypothetical protein
MRRISAKNRRCRRISAKCRGFRYVGPAAIVTEPLPEKIDWQRAEEGAVKAGRLRRKLEGTWRLSIPSRQTSLNLGQGILT